MGFSLKMFFEELNAILNDDEPSNTTKVLALTKLVEEMEIYARECGDVI